MRLVLHIAYRRINDCEMALEGIVSPDWLKMKTPQRRPEALADTPGAGGAGDLGEDGG
jgi:hypothetical protein